jgi:hypothetical protein
MYYYLRVRSVLKKKDEEKKRKLNIKGEAFISKPVKPGANNPC